MAPVAPSKRQIWLERSPRSIPRTDPHTLLEFSTANLLSRLIARCILHAGQYSDTALQEVGLLIPSLQWGGAFQLLHCVASSGSDIESLLGCGASLRR